MANEGRLSFPAPGRGRPGININRSMRTMKQLFARFKEPSSWAGLTAVVGMMGLSIDPGVVQSVTLIGAGVCGLLAFFLPEGSAAAVKK